MSVLFSAEPRFIRIVFNFSLTKRSEEGRTILIREDMFTFTLHNALVALYNPSNMRLETIYIRGYILYLTIIPRGRVGYEMIDSQRGA